MRQDESQPSAAPAPQVITWEVVVTGHVQGVGYRYFAQAAAQSLGVTGWVRNEWDGGVRAVLQHADKGVLSRMVVALKHGPPHGWVQDCAVAELAAPERFGDFTIRH
jgi:acylphosphatase